MKDMSLEELLELIKTGEKTSKEIFEYFHDRIKKHNPTLNAFTNVNSEGFNSSDSLLQGLPLGVKDIFSEKGIVTSGASKMLEDFIPTFESTTTARLLDKGMSSIGKTNMDEFAMGTTGENSAFGNTLNPWGKSRIPGGSSSGSASAVAAGLVPAALGTDTGGSVRQPAFLCGVVGFKPTYGRNSRFGVHAMASSLDCPATFTKTVKDAALLYNITNGEDPQDATSILGKDVIDLNNLESSNIKGKKIGIPAEYFDEALDQKVKATINLAIETLKGLGAEIVDISLPMTKYGVTAYYILCPAEVTTNLARLDGLRYGFNSDKQYSNIDEFYQNNRTDGLGDEVQRRTIIGNYVLSAGFYDAYYKKAAQVRTLIIGDFDKAFETVDAIVAPCSPEAAWKLGEKSDDPMKMYAADAYTIPPSLAGLPGISVPCGFVEDGGEKLPVGIQILTPRLKEKELFEIAHVYEQAAGWREKMIPEGFED